MDGFVDGWIILGSVCRWMGNDWVHEWMDGGSVEFLLEWMVMDEWLTQLMSEVIPSIDCHRQSGTISDNICTWWFNKSKPNCLWHIYLMLDHILLKLFTYLENSTKNMIPTHRNILFNS